MNKRIMACLLVISLFLGMGTVASAQAGARNRRISPVLVVAHRAGAAAAPENTVEALMVCEENGAGIAEIDVQQLADGTLIVMHDHNFLRTTGVDRNVWEVTWEEVSEYRTLQGNARIPTLEQMLQWAEGRVQLMIEVKYTGHETDLLERLVGQVRQFSRDGEHIIGSQTLRLVEEVKTLAPEIETVYIASMLEEDQYELEYVDSFSICVSALTDNMVERIHEQNKPVYAWTVNSGRYIRMALDCNVDGLVSDDVPLAITMASRR